eukprot:14291563-Alexandrium_andersonii.AAC.1
MRLRRARWPVSSSPSDLARKMTTNPPDEALQGEQCGRSWGEGQDNAVWIRRWQICRPPICIPISD